MAVIPLKQVVKVLKKGESDGWGKKSEAANLTLKCRFQEGIDREEMVRQGMTDLVLNAKIWFDKYPNITLEDKIEFTNEHGETLTLKPRNIDVIRGINGKPMFTVVLV